MRLRPTIVELFVLVVGLPVFASLAFDEYSSYCGKRDGLADVKGDIAAGRLRLKLGGKWQPWDENLVRLCESRYGIEVQHIYGCCPRPYESAYGYAYNEEMLRHLAQTSPGFSLDAAFDAAYEKWTNTRDEVRSDYHANDGS